MQAEVYEVEEILQERAVPRGPGFVTEYKVKWKGYSAAEATWEPVENLDGCRDLVRKFQEKQKPKNMPKTPSKQNPKQKTPPKPKGNSEEAQGDKDVLAAYRNDFYFSDESNVHPSNGDKGNEVEPQREPNPSQSSLEVDLKANKSKSKDSPQGSVEKSKRGRRKKEKAEASNKEQAHSEPSRRREKMGRKQAEEKRKPVEPLPRRVIEKKQTQQPIYRYKAVRRQQVIQRTVSTQTSLLTKADCGMKVISMHTSLQFPEKVWFTVEQGGRFIEISREKLLWSNPRTLYNFYHEHYLRGKARSAQMEAEMMEIMREQIAGKVLEDSESDSDGSAPLDYFAIAQDYDQEDPSCRRRFEKLIRSLTFKPKTDKCLQDRS